MSVETTNGESNLIILFEGYSEISKGVMKANSSSTLIKGSVNVIIDTRTAWDGQKLVEKLKEEGLTPEQINYVVCTHGHSDHIGCNYLFKNAVHIVGFGVSKKDKYFLKPDLSRNEEFSIAPNITVIPTPGHTMQDVTVLFKTNLQKVTAITGDLFEKEADLLDENIWIEAGSDSVELQRKNRRKILELADYIVPGHGPMFKVVKVEFDKNNKIISFCKN